MLGRTTALSLALFAVQAVPSLASPQVGSRLEGMDYESARTVILGYGWKPHPTESGGPDVKQSISSHYSELGYCQGTGRGECGMTFTKDARCLFVATVESPPGQGGSTIVIEATFAKHPCPTS